jgi:putative tricarboxylic transport membrane protein
MRPTTDLLAGLAFIGFGAAGLLLTAGLPIGSLRAMGSGYLPLVVGWLLVGLGAVIALKGMVAGERLERGAWAALAWLAGALALFALSIERLGLPLAVLASVMIGARAGGDGDWRESFAFGAALALFCAALFVGALGLNIRLVPAWSF